jgi:hypothetical protein
MAENSTTRITSPPLAEGAIGWTIYHGTPAYIPEAPRKWTLKRWFADLMWKAACKLMGRSVKWNV